MHKGRRLELRLGRRLRLVRYIEALPGKSSGSHWGHRQVQNRKMGPGCKQVQSYRMGQDCKQALIDSREGDQRKDYLVVARERD